MIEGGTGSGKVIEITDEAAATFAAVDRGSPGVRDVIDDDPALVAESLPY